MHQHEPADHTGGEAADEFHPVEQRVGSDDHPDRRRVGVGGNQRAGEEEHREDDDAGVVEVLPGPDHGGDEHAERAEEADEQ